MNVLLLGSGGREHALAIAIAKSPLLMKLFVSPGNPGMASLAETVKLDFADHEAIASFCQLMAIDLVVVGPEAPLVAGLTDHLSALGIKVFGPTKAAAQLEGSKAFAKEFCQRHAIPTAAYACFGGPQEAKAYMRSKGVPIVIKADGLASGKGVRVAISLDEAEEAIDWVCSGQLGAASQTFLIEEFLQGEEVSFFALCDGHHTLEFACAQDHKRVGEGETGPNTGGMGAYSPAPILDASLRDTILREIIAPTLNGMDEIGAPFKGVLFAGLMITKEGPKLIEYNVRFGDPETQAMLPRLEEDLLPLLLGAAEGRLPDRPLRFSLQTALSIVYAAKGYPDAPQKGSEIRGLERAAAMPFVTVTHAGTKRVGDKLVADGGRVLNITALGKDVAEAHARAYAAIEAIDWTEGFYRRDIGWRALPRR